MCSNTTPLALPVTDVLLTNGFSMRGVLSAVGTPPQNISFYPIYNNDTFIWNSTSHGYCNTFASSVTTAGCTTLRGGLYDPSNSSTTHSEVDAQTAGADTTFFPEADTAGANLVDAEAYTDTTWVQDALDLAGYAVENYPLGMATSKLGQPDYVSQALLGMGTHSTVLVALHAAGRIASRSFSWWWGLDGATSDVHMDGQIVFGGYDAAKVTGDNHTALLASQTEVNCPSGMYVDISDMLLGFPNGSTQTLLGSSTLSACLDITSQVVVSFGSDPYFTTFEQLTGTENIGREANPGFAFWGMLFDPDNVYDGELIIKLSSGLTITIPNDILVVAPQYVANDGSVQTNNSVRELLINPLAGSEAQSTPALGKQFFSQTYLMVDYDAETFTLWEANPTTESNLVALAQNCTVSVGNTTTNSTEPSPSHTGTPAKATQSASVPDFSLSPGAIAGIAVGSTAVAVAVAAAVILLVLHRRQKNATVFDDTKTSPEDDNTTSYGYKAELDADQLLQELSASERRPNELAADSRPSELSNEGMRHEKPAENVDPVELG